MRLLTTITAVCLPALAACTSASFADKFYVRFDRTPTEAEIAHWGLSQPKEIRQLRDQGILDWPYWHITLPTDKRGVVAAELGLPEDAVHIPAQATTAGSTEWWDDPLLPQQWSWIDTRSDAARRWLEQIRPMRNIRVGVLDSGIHIEDNHDLQNQVVDGWSPWMHSGRPEDGPFNDNCGHGTFVTAQMAAVTNNGFGLASLGSDTGIDYYSLRCLGWCGGSLEDIVDGAIIGMFFFDCDILTVSLQWWNVDPAWELAMDLAKARQKIVVVAAGNQGQPQVSAAASHDWSVAVAAHNSLRKRASFSNYGKGLDLSAPGDSILGLSGANPFSAGNFQYWKGTSMAAPLVSVTYAAILSRSRPFDDQGWSADILHAKVLRSCDPGDFTQQGSGYLNSMKALMSGVECSADILFDGQVNTFDFLKFQTWFSLGDPAADYDGDGVLTIFDFLAFQDSVVNCRY